MMLSRGNVRLVQQVLALFSERPVWPKTDPDSLRRAVEDAKAFAEATLKELEEFGASRAPNARAEILNSLLARLVEVHQDLSRSRGDAEERAKLHRSWTPAADAVGRSKEWPEPRPTTVERWLAQTADRALALHVALTDCRSRIGGSSTIQKEIRFRPEHQQAGASVLAYFAQVLRQKLPDTPTEVAIAQAGEWVTMIITYPDGREEEIRQVLHDFGDVLRDELEIQTFLPNPLHALALKNKLEVAKLEVQQTRELLIAERRHSDQRLSNLESEVLFLREQLSSALAHGHSTADRLLEAYQSEHRKTSTVEAKLVGTLADAIVKRDVQLFEQALSRSKAQPAGLFARISEFLLSSSCSGVVGNAAYDWLKVLVAGFPR